MPHAWLPPSLMRQPFSSACLNAASISLSGCTLRNISPPINGHHEQVVKRQPNLAVLVVTQAQTTVCSTHRTRSPARDSSPRVRGTRLGRSFPLPAGRFIPACAGNAAGIAPGHHRHAVHPRVCGERMPLRISAPDLSGSSRVCGERRLPSKWMLPSCGSSPRVRGTPELVAAAGCAGRFIPACAGNAVAASSTRSRATVHPRVCGERAAPARSPARQAGSSPRVRGTRDKSRKVIIFHRFIPACAGNAVGRSGETVTGAVHPRVCGERVCQPWLASICVGSSPRVRGTPLGSNPPNAGRRFIPACAGNACK